MDLVVVPVFRKPYACHTEHFIIIISRTVHKITIGDQPVLLQRISDIIESNKIQESFPVFLIYILVCVIPEPLAETEMLSRRRLILILLIIPVADGIIQIQIRIIHGPVIGRHCRDQAVLPYPLLFLLQKPFLQLEPLLQLLLPDPVFCLRCFLFQKKLRSFPVLGKSKRKQDNKTHGCEKGLDHTPAKRSGRNGADLVTDHAFPDQIRKKPVGSDNRHIAKSFPDAVISKGNLTALSVSKFTQKALIGIALLEFRLLHSIQKIILHRQTAQDRIAKGHAILRIYIAEGRSVFICLHGNALQHFVHIDLHEADLKRFSVKGNFDRNGNDYLLVRTVQIQNGYFRLAEIFMIEAIFIDIILRSQRSIDFSVCIHKCEFFQLIQLFHPALVSLQMGRIADILLRHQADRHLHILDVLPEVIFNDLLPPSGQLVQIKKADLPHCLLCILRRAPSQDVRTDDDDCKNSHRPDDIYRCCDFFSFFFQFAPPNASVLYKPS